jgi:hypothetical protein
VKINNHYGQSFIIIFLLYHPSAGKATKHLSAGGIFAVQKEKNLPLHEKAIKSDKIFKLTGQMK